MGFHGLRSVSLWVAYGSIEIGGFLFCVDTVVVGVFAVVVVTVGC